MPSVFPSHSLFIFRNCLRNQTRILSTKQKKLPVKKYSNTIHLPQTEFPHWFSAAKRISLDEQILKNCGFNELYSWQRKNVVGEDFVLHDGPPYANGPAHMGHALNKLLKDIIMRHKLLQGYKIHYKPGWDCHGLPIELKALVDSSIQQLTPLEIRKRARVFAERAISDQKAAFKSWAILADWDQDCYFTFDNKYVTNQLIQFYNLYEKGFIYRDMKPVYWSPTARTALAEAELEYHPDHKSIAWTLRLPINMEPWLFQEFTCLPTNEQLYVLIWTTTPWTLPANQAIAYNQEFNYVFVKFTNLDGIYIVAEKLVSNLEKILQRNGKVLAIFSGEKLKNCFYKHPMKGDENCQPLLHGNHVTSEVGTGLVHTAPAHGHEDFLLALENNINFTCLVNELGNYTPNISDRRLHNMPVLSDKTRKVLSNIFSKNILSQEEIVHSYPYDWRTNTPVIIRSCMQWFVKTDTIKEKAMASLKDVNIMPPKSAQSLNNLIESRPYWCISRQRTWGVPIPVVYKTSTSTSHELPIINRELIDNYCQLLLKHGTDFWWSMKLSEIVPEDILKKLNLNLNELKQGQDILDIWFDSGLSWSSVLEGRKADLYLEGTDQSTGWFQSSLLTSVALTGSAPYKNIYIHGFAVDNEGRKMSKSLGNVINPYEIIIGSDNKKKKALGIDVLRWWVGAHASQHTNVPVSETTLTNSVEALKKLRNTIKFLLGSINDLPIQYVDEKFTNDLSIINTYILHALNELLSKVIISYDCYQFSKVCQRVANFVSNELAFYFIAVKDKLYCNDEDSVYRRNIQRTMYHILNTLAKCIAPITPVLVEEIFTHHPHYQGKLFFQTQIPNIPVDELQLTKEEVDLIMDKIFQIKQLLANECPVNITTAQLWCTITVNNDIYSILQVCS